VLISCLHNEYSIHHFEWAFLDNTFWSLLSIAHNLGVVAIPLLWCLGFWPYFNTTIFVPWKTKFLTTLSQSCPNRNLGFQMTKSHVQLSRTINYSMRFMLINTLGKFLSVFGGHLYMCRFASFQNGGILHLLLLRVRGISHLLINISSLSLLRSIKPSPPTPHNISFNWCLTMGDAHG
jgi:hypothetical protein